MKKDTRQTAEDMRLRVARLMRQFGIKSRDTKASGQVHGDGDALLEGFMIEEKHKSTKGWSISQSELHKAQEQAERMCRRLLFITENNSHEMLVCMPINHFMPLLCCWLNDTEDLTGDDHD